MKPAHRVMDGKRKKPAVPRRPNVNLTPGGYAVFDETSPVGYVNFDDRAVVTQLNDAAAKLLGVQRKSFLGMPLPAALAANEVPRFLEHLQRCRAGSHTQINTELTLGKNDQRIPVELATAPTIVGGHRRFPTAIIDLRGSEKRLQLLVDAKDLAEHLFEFVSHPMAALNENLVIQATNSAFRGKFKARANELHGHSLSALDPVHWNTDEFIPSLRCVVTQHKTLKDFKLDCSLAVSGQRLTLLANAVRLDPRPEHDAIVLLTFEDITHRWRHEQEREVILSELQELNARLEQRVRERTSELANANEQLRALSQRVIEAQEGERRHLARELHDEIGQQLTGLNLMLHRVNCGNHWQKEMDEARKIVVELMQHVRQLSVNLRPAVLDDLGLLMAVRWQIDTFAKRTRIGVQFDASHFEERNISPEAKITIFRALQESLTNIARHAGTKRASVALRTDARNLVLEVADDGKGFDPAQSGKNGGTGLSGMRERVALAGGQLELESVPGRGTHLLVRLPSRSAGGGGRS